MARSPLILALALAALVAGSGCRGTSSDAARLQDARATAEAEEKAQETSLTSATLESKDEARQGSDEALRARGEMIAAFQLEQSDYRTRLQHALDLLDREVVHPRHGGPQRERESRARDLRARRDLLKGDLVAVDRSTEQDWATLRTKVERDLESGKPGAQLAPRTDHVAGEAP